MLSVYLRIFLVGEFHQEFQPEPSLVGDNDNSGEERDQFTHGTDVLHSEFINCIKASWGSTNFFIYYLWFKVCSRLPIHHPKCQLLWVLITSSQSSACLFSDIRSQSLPYIPLHVLAYVYDFLLYSENTQLSTTQCTISVSKHQNFYDRSVKVKLDKLHSLFNVF